MAVKWIITDIDGCLSPEESVPWDLDLFWKLARLSQDASAGKGPIAPLTLCTGRPQPYAEVLTKILDIRVPVICENGAVLYALEDNVSRYGPGVTEEKILGLRGIRAFIETEILPLYSDVVVQFGKEAQISVYCARPEVFPAIERLIEEFSRKNGPELVISPTHYYLNISLAGINKGKTLELLLDQLGTSRSEAAGIGDTVGDLPLREAVGFFACPSNSHPSLKEKADYVSPYPTTRGILDILSLPEMQRKA